MDEEQLPPLPEKLPDPCAWLVSGGRTFVDRAYLKEAHAEQSIADRKDGAKMRALYTADQLKAAVAAERERCAKVCEDRAGTMSMFATSRDARDHNAAVRGCAAAIRAGAEGERG